MISPPRLVFSVVLRRKNPCKSFASSTPTTRSSSGAPRRASLTFITRSGTNDWHGILYEYFRNNVMDATNLLQANGAHALRQNQFGGAIGGPLQKDRTFIYGNYEGQRRGESPFLQFRRSSEH